MKSASFAAAAVAFLAAVANAAEVGVAGGLIRGETLADGSAVYRGIPYAAPPTGSLRWKPPAPALKWTGVRDAVKEPAPCAQLNEGWNSAEAAAGGEDCL
jgi:para-nitrobenzyl esterase